MVDRIQFSFKRKWIETSLEVFEILLRIPTRLCIAYDAFRLYPDIAEVLQIYTHI